MEGAPRSRGRASVRHSRAVSTPPVRSVHPMDPIGSLGRGWLALWKYSLNDKSYEPGGDSPLSPSNGSTLKLNIIPLS